MEKESDPGPVPESESGVLEHNELGLLTGLISLMLSEMRSELLYGSSVTSMYAPFQPLVRQLVTAAMQYFSDSDHSMPGLRDEARALLDSGKLDSPSVARAPTPQELSAILIYVVKGSRLESEQDWQGLGIMFQQLTADAMDCAYKQAIAAPQTVGSRFARPDPA
jgi:hypothetical protein